MIRGFRRTAREGLGFGPAGPGARAWRAFGWGVGGEGGRRGGRCKGGGGMWLFFDMFLFCIWECGLLLALS